MKQLTLIRHAKSSWSDPSLGDFDRPLNARGLEDAPRMGAYLKANGCPPVDQIVSSPALRARTTAKLIAEKLGMTNELIVLEPCIYEATLHRLFKLIGALDDAHPHVMLFGHNIAGARSRKVAPVNVASFTQRASELIAAPGDRCPPFWED